MDNPTTSPIGLGKRRRVDSRKSSESDSNSKKDKSTIQLQTTITTAKLATKKDGPCHRNQSLWDTTKKGIFFDAVNEFGKDFDKIHNYFNTKIRKVYGNVDIYHAIKKEQVKDFFSNTLKKTSQVIDMKKLHNLLVNEGSVDDTLIKEYREVLCLLSYWQVMKHAKRIKWPTDKLHSKINELTFQGATCLRVKSRNFYVHRMTPKYFVGLMGGKLPTEFTVDILPFNNWSWGIVQNIAQNPRIRLKVSSKKSVAEIIKMLLTKWEKAKDSSTLETLNLCLHAPTSSKYRLERSKVNDTTSGRKRSSCSHSESAAESAKTKQTDDKQTENKQTEKKQTENRQTEKKQTENRQTEKKQTEKKQTEKKRTESEAAKTPTVPDQVESVVVTEEQSDSMIVNNIAKEVDVTSVAMSTSECEASVENCDVMSDVITDANLIETNPENNTSITEEDLDDLIDNIDTAEEITVPVSSSSVKMPHIPKRNIKTFFHQKNKESDEMSAERDRLVSMECWDINTPNLLTIGHIYMKFASPITNKEFHIEYEWKIGSGESKVNSTHNTLALKRLFNLGNTEFQRISKQGKYRDLFITLNMEKWTGVLPSCKSVETQTDQVEPTPQKVQMVSTAVQVGKDRLILPQPTKLGGFIVPAPVTTPKTPPNNSFNLPKRPFVKRKQPVQRVLLPKPTPHIPSNQLVVSRDIGCTGQVKATPYCRDNVPGVTLSTLIPDGHANIPPANIPLSKPSGAEKQTLYNDTFFATYTSSNDYENEMSHWSGNRNEEEMSTLNSLVAEHSNHSLPGDVTSREGDVTSRDTSRAHSNSIIDHLHLGYPP